MVSTTVAVPLHRSEPWADNVYENVRRLPPAVTEILISDRTCVDDAARGLESRLADDPRVRVIAEPRGLAWSEHYQLLVEEASGELFMWMPHDDIFEASWVPTLTDALETYPSAWLAYGRMESVEADGATSLPQQFSQPEPGLYESWSVLDLPSKGVAFRGLFRRRQVLSAGIRLEPFGPHPAIDSFWVLAVGLRSGVVFDDRTATLKRFHPDNLHAGWRPNRGDHHRSTLVVLRRHGSGGPTGAMLRKHTRRRLAISLTPRWMIGAGLRARSQLRRVKAAWTKTTP